MGHDCLYRSCISFCRMLNNTTKLPRVSTRLISQIFCSTSSLWSLIHPTLQVSLTSICELRHKPSLNVNSVKIPPTNDGSLVCKLRPCSEKGYLCHIFHIALFSVIVRNYKKLVSCLKMTSYELDQGFLNFVAPPLG
jgi:hypothetical protein